MAHTRRVELEAWNQPSSWPLLVTHHQHHSDLRIKRFRPFLTILTKIHLPIKEVTIETDESEKIEYFFIGMSSLFARRYSQKEKQIVKSTSFSIN